MSRLIPLVFPGFCAVGLLVMFFVGLPVAAAVRDLVGGNIGMALAIASAAPFALMAVLVTHGCNGRH